MDPILGHTTSGKRVFRNVQNVYSTFEYRDFTAQDHIDASKLHEQAEKNYSDTADKHYRETGQVLNENIRLSTKHHNYSVDHEDMAERLKK